MTKILIAGYYGLGNIGDEAILSGMIASLNKYLPNAEYSVITNDSNDTTKLHNVTPIEQSITKGAVKFIGNQITGKEFGQIYKSINQCDIFILGGGGLLQDSKIHYLPSYLSLLELAKRKNKKTVIYGIGAGPIDTKLGKSLCKKVLNHIDLVSVRDKESKIALENAGVRNVLQTADPAFGNDIPSLAQLNEELAPLERQLGHDYFCTTLHSRLYNDDLYRNNNGRGIDLDTRRKKMAQYYDQIISTYHKDILCIPTAPPDYPGFIKLKQDIKYKDHMVVLDHSSSYKRIMGLLLKSDLLIGMRLHSMILATILGVPFAPISYSKKVNGFLEISKLDGICVDIEEIDNDYFVSKLLDNTKKVYENRLTYSEILKENSKTFRSKTLENAKVVSDLLNG